MVPTLFSPVSWGYLAVLGRMNLFDLSTLPSLLLVLGLHGWLWPPFRGHKIPNRLGLLLASLQLPRPIVGCPCGESRQLSLYTGLVLLSRNACLGLGTLIAWESKGKADPHTPSLRLLEVSVEVVGV